MQMTGGEKTTGGRRTCPIPQSNALTCLHPSPIIFFAIFCDLTFIFFFALSAQISFFIFFFLPVCHSRPSALFAFFGV